MNNHFSSFTPEAMRAFGKDLADGLQRRTEFLKNTRNHTLSMLASFRKEHTAAAAQRRERASSDADARRLFMSELKSGVHSLLGRFELSRKEMARDLQDMSRELHAAGDAFRNRSRHHDGPARPGPASHQAKQGPSGGGAKPFRAAPDHHGGPKPSATTQPPRAAAANQDGPNARPGADHGPGDATQPQTDSKKHQS